jgi:ankyrin repeat protein
MMRYLMFLSRCSYSNNTNGIVQYMLTTCRDKPWESKLLRAANSPDEIGFRPLHIAAGNGDFPAVIALIRAGVQPSYCLHCEKDGSLPADPVNVAREALKRETERIQAQDDQKVRTFGYIIEYLDEMTKIQFVENAKYQIALVDEFLPGMCPPDLADHFSEKVEEMGLPPLDEVPDGPNEFADQSYCHEPADIYAASIQSIKIRLRRKPLEIRLRQTGDFFQRLARVIDGTDDEPHAFEIPLGKQFSSTLSLEYQLTDEIR